MRRMKWLVTQPIATLEVGGRQSAWRRLLRWAWISAVICALFEPKQVAYFTGGLHWPYPEYLILAFIAFFYCVTRRRTPTVPRPLLKLYALLVLFAVVYFLTSVLNLFLTPTLNSGQLLNGTFRVVLQYLIAPPLILVTLHYLYHRNKQDVLRSFLIPAVVELLIFFAGLLLFLSGSTSSIAVHVRNEILTQSWIFIGNHAFFVPKWGATFAETQELDFSLFLVYMMMDLRKQDQIEPQSNPLTKVLRICLLLLIVMTGSKGVLIAFLIYALFRSRRHIGIKLALIVAVVVPVAGLLIYKAQHNSVEFLNAALSGASVDERLFHIINCIQLMSASPVHFLIGLGSRQYGDLVNRQFPLYFSVKTTPVSMFGVVADSGVMGAICYLAIPVYIWTLLREYRERLVLIAAFIANLWMPDWSMEIYTIFLIVFAYANYYEYSHSAGDLALQGAETAGAWLR